MCRCMCMRISVRSCVRVRMCVCVLVYVRAYPHEHGVFSHITIQMPQTCKTPTECHGTKSIIPINTKLLKAFMSSALAFDRITGSTIHLMRNSCNI